MSMKIWRRNSASFVKLRQTPGTIAHHRTPHASRPNQPNATERRPDLKLLLASVTARKLAKSEPCETLVRDYIIRATRFAPTEAASFASEAALLAAADRQPGRPAATIVLCDASGNLLSSEDLANLLRQNRDAGTPRMLFGIGPADGWSKSALARAAKVVSFGRITLPHELARVVLAEQLYRALTILAGHPYHSGH